MTYLSLILKILEAAGSRPEILNQPAAVENPNGEFFVVSEVRMQGNLMAGLSAYHLYLCIERPYETPTEQRINAALVRSPKEEEPVQPPPFVPGKIEAKGHGADNWHDPRDHEA